MMTRLVALLAVLLGTAHGNASGQMSCYNAPASPHNGLFVSGLTPPFTIKLKQNGVVVTRYTPGATYDVELAGVGTQQHKGFVMAPFRGTKAAVGTNYVGGVKVGRLTAVDTNAQAQSMCAGGITHTSSTLKSISRGRWVAPAAGTGTVTFFSIVVRDYTNAWRVYLEVAEAVTPTKTASRTRTRTRSQTKKPRM